MWVLFLLAAWGVALASIVRLCRVVRIADAPAPSTDTTRVLTLYETAFLAGGPERVTDLALVSMARRRRLLLAHTGWATVVDPRGGDDIECSVVTAIGPGGQSPVAAVRAAVAAAEAVRALGERLAAAGPAVPSATRTAVAAGVRQARLAAVVVVAVAVVAVLLLPEEADLGAAVAWFALPSALTVSCLAIVRFEVGPRAPWASPAGQSRLRAAAEAARGTTVEVSGAPGPYDGLGDHALLTVLALRGPSALADPTLRAALRADTSPHRTP
ncbi:TIGR04222 domain-containing membrane protein [Streptomyces megasporus]|uniref:TIGR04222 domain-containing membrane protein n=1 Tax=Streptomyces megasporus TaxID=44060 RepID=UPI0004E1DDE0|nr:TIGR04222 domain-containing membrane protein [Streptomyces megasporus]